MISGANLLNPVRHISLKKIYFKYVFRVLKAYLIWSCIYAVWDGVYQSGKLAFATTIIRGKYHLWFLPMIAGIYILIPVLRKLTENLAIAGYFLALALAFTFFIPAVFSVLRFSEGSVFYALTHAFEEVYSDMKFHFTLGYTAFFVAGYFFETIVLQLPVRRMIYLLGIGAACITIGTIYYAEVYSAPPIENDFYFLLDALEAAAMFVFVKYNISPRLSSAWWNQYIRNISNYTFGIYLVHAMVLDELKKLGMNIKAIPILQIPVNVILIFGISMGITYCLRKIPLLRRIV